MSDAITSEVGIANLAILKLGQEPIMSLADNDEPGPTMNRRYAGARDAVLRLHPWSCAMHTNLSLTLKNETGPGGFTNVFDLPPDFIRLKNVQNLHFSYRIFGSPDGGKRLATNQSKIELDYVFRQTSVLAMDEGLKEAIATKLAADTCMKLTGDHKLKTKLDVELKEIIALAEMSDMQEQPPTDAIHPTGWQNAFRTGVFAHDQARFDD